MNSATMKQLWVSSKKEINPSENPQRLRIAVFTRFNKLKITFAIARAPSFDGLFMAAIKRHSAFSTLNTHKLLLLKLFYIRVPVVEPIKNNVSLTMIHVT